MSRGLETSFEEHALEAHSKSFTLASRLLGPRQRRDVAVLYAWCRRADDAVDLAPPVEQPARLERLRHELETVYAGRVQCEPLLLGLQRVVLEAGVPAEYPRALLDGMEMDVSGTAYATLADLHRYCFRVAGVVGLMLCHVLGVRDAAARRPAAQLGMAMQLTNVCRDVLEDWERGRLYLPDEVLAAAGAGELRRCLGAPLDPALRRPLGLAVERLLAVADGLYDLADAGIPALPLRAGLAVRVARRAYSEIGTTLRARRCDVFSGRAVVSPLRKAGLVVGALVDTLASVRAAWRFRPAPLPGIVEFPEGVLD